MSNVFQNTSETYFQIPKRIVTDGILKQLMPSSMALYITILKQTQEKSSTVVMFNTSTLLDSLAIARGNLRIARAQLLEYNLVRSTEVKRGLWMFEVLTRHGKGLDNSIIDLDKLSRVEVESFYLPHLINYDAMFNADDNVISNCPFCSRGLNKKSFHLKLTDDGMGIGVWHCFECQKAGRMIDFEMYRTRVNKAEALKQVQNFFMRQREGDPEAPKQVTLPLPSGVEQYIKGLENDEPQAI
jgi:hypothetical protein